MANEEHLKILKQGVKVWNRWREDNLLIMPDLSGKRFELFNLEGADLTSVNLSNCALDSCAFNHAYLKGVQMHRTTLTGVDFVEADLSRSDIEFAHFIYCDFKETNLKHSSIYYTTFLGGYFDNTNFSYSDIMNISFNQINLSLAQGLENIQHLGSSNISIDTLYKSAGKIPESFLRGCGIPDDFITFIPSIIGAQQAIQFYSCFISYSSKDEEFARRLYSRMRDEKLRVWFAPEDLAGGRKFYEQIEQAIHMHDRLLVILSEESMQSKWVIREIRNARKIEVEQDRRKLFPISLVDFDAIRSWKCLDTDSGDDLAEELRSYHIPDFSDWKNHDSFEKGFERLMRDLRAEESRQARERGEE